MLSDTSQRKKATYCMIPTLWHLKEEKTMETVKSWVVARDCIEDGQVEHRGLLGQWNWSVWYYKSRYTQLHICQNPQNVWHPEWTLM